MKTLKPNKEIMNYKFLKLSLYIGAVLSIFAACVKPHDATFTDFSKTGDLVIMQNAGLSNYTATSFSRGSDTIKLTVRVDLASKEIPTSPTTVKLAVDNAAITSYNAANPQPGYVILPSANFKLVSNTLTIPAGSHYAETILEVYTKGLDPAVSYMVPISITDAGGKALSSNANTAYWHSIGNPLAGTYNWSFYRWNGTTDTTTPPNSTVFTDQPTAISPLGPSTLLFPESYINTFVDPSDGITLNFTNTNGTFSNFVATFSNTLKDEITAGGFTLVKGPLLVGYSIVGDASTKYKGSHFRFYTELLNSTPAKRTVIDDFVKQ